MPEVAKQKVKAKKAEKPIVIEKADVPQTTQFDVEEAKAAAKPKWEVWWSRLDPEHTICYTRRDEHDSKVGPYMSYIKFDNYRLDIGALNTSDFRKKEIQDGLHESGREGRDIYIIGKTYGDESNVTDVDLMKTLRELSLSFDGVNKIKGLFSNRELIKHGINPYTRDVDELIMLALKTKNIRGKIQVLDEEA